VSARTLPRLLAVRAGAWSLACALLVALPGLASARVRTVPDDFPTIQAALDWFALVEPAVADTLLLRGLDFAETPTVSGSVVIERVPGDPAEPRPRIAGLDIWLGVGVLAGLRGVDVSGGVDMGVSSPSEIWFEDCHLDGIVRNGSDDGHLSRLTFKRCSFGAGAQLAPGGECVFDSCDVVGGISVNWSDAHLSVTHCMIRGGGAGAGIGGNAIGYGYFNNLDVSETTIRGFAAGIVVELEGSGVISNNVIEDCTYGGIYVINAETARIAGNHVRRCGIGARVTGYHLDITDNTIESSSSTGLLALVDDAACTIAGNVVSSSGEAGIRVIGSPPGPFSMHNNTTCSNAGSGLLCEMQDLYAATTFEVVRNVGFANGGYGLEWRLPPVGQVSCNDWFGNSQGPVGGGSLAADDFVAEPAFCDTANGNYHPSQGSPLLDRLGCGLVGALELGCRPTAPADPAFRIVRITPLPARGPIQIELALPSAAEVSVELFDLQGRNVATLARGARPAGHSTVEWSGRAAGGPVRAGLYLVRYRFPGGEDARRLVVL
jgi:parallel beta-helix repeat protein